MPLETFIIITVVIRGLLTSTGGSWPKNQLPFDVDCDSGQHAEQLTVTPLAHQLLACVCQRIPPHIPLAAVCSRAGMKASLGLVKFPITCYIRWQRAASPLAPLVE